jgi:hypothetical protein
MKASRPLASTKKRAVCVFSPGRIEARDCHLIRGTRNIGACDSSFLADFRAVFRRILQQNVIELPADHLEGEIGLVLNHVIEAPSRRDISVAVDKTHTRFADEILLQLINHAQILQERVAKRQERFADVFTGKFFPFEQEHPVPSPGKPSSCTRPSRTAPDNNDVVCGSF